MTRHIDVDSVVSPLSAMWQPNGRTDFGQLRRKLRWLLLLAYLVPLLVLAAYFSAQYYLTLREGILNHLRSVAENQRNTVDLFLQERVANLKNVFSPDSLPVPASAGEMKKALAELRRESRTWTWDCSDRTGPWFRMRGRTRR